MHVHLLCEKVQNVVRFTYVQVLLPQYVDVIVWPCAVVSPPDVQNCSNFRDLQCESPLQRAISEATTQKECNSKQEQNSFLRMYRAALYEQHDVAPSSYTTEPRHRALMNGMTTKWCENGVYKIATTKCCQCVLLAAMTVTKSVGEWLNCDQDWQCYVFCSPDMVGSLFLLNSALLNSHYYKIVVFSYLNLHGCLM
jgi:hypothetical protein